MLRDELNLWVGFRVWSLLRLLRIGVIALSMGMGRLERIITRVEFKEIRVLSLGDKFCLELGIFLDKMT